MEGQKGVKRHTIPPLLAKLKSLSIYTYVLFCFKFVCMNTKRSLQLGGRYGRIEIVEDVRGGGIARRFDGGLEGCVRSI